jgi:GrpB-like predicted nucleotidyltransferase (UPF0157 family)
MVQIKNLTGKPGITEYKPYDQNLPDIFQLIKGLIHQELPGIRIEHVGSTSVPGIGGRNAIDIAIPASESEHESIKAKLYKIGFNDSPWQHYIPLLVGLIDYQDKTYPILLYVLSPDSPVFKGWLKYRDYMRIHPEDAQAYDNEKQKNIKAGAVKTDDYQKAKTPFIISMVQKIEQSDKGD